jgi:hypothetical protein
MSLVDSWKIYVCKEIYAHWLLDFSLYVCVFLTSYLTVFSGLDTCVCWFLVEDLTLFFFFFGYGFSLYSVYPLSFCDKKGEYFLFLDQECISKLFKCFLSQNGQMGSLLVFYFGYILNDINTLCNGCFLTGLSVLFRVFK